jgi:hypothetical protein
MRFLPDDCRGEKPRRSMERIFHQKLPRFSQDATRHQPALFDPVFGFRP